MRYFRDISSWEKCLEKGANWKEWLKPQVEKARTEVGKKSIVDVLSEITADLSSAGALNNEKWTELLHSCNPSASEVEQVIDFLTERGFGRKTQFKSIWKERKKELDKQVTFKCNEGIIKEISKTKKRIQWNPRNYTQMVSLVEEGLLDFPGRWPYLRYAGCLCYVKTDSPITGHAID